MKNNFDQIPVSGKLNERVDQTLAVIRKKHRNRIAKKAMIGIGSAAAVFVGILVLGTADPALASKLPFVGHFFEKVEKQVSYKGNFSEEAVQLSTEDSYIRTSGGITITVSEITYTRQAMYLAMCIENEEEFPEDFIRSKNREHYTRDYDILQTVADGSIEGIEDTNIMMGYVEGQFEDSHTFVGIGRIDLANFYHYPDREEIEAAGLDEAESTIGESDYSEEEAVKRIVEYNKKLKEAFPDANTLVELPDEFTLTLTISDIWSEQKNYSGDWSFRFDVKLDDSKIDTVTLNETNDRGEGIGKVERSPYEISATMLLPEDALDCRYYIAICDADGDLLEFQGNSFGTYQTYGRDTDTVSVYLCDYDEYMDELKGYYWSEDYEEKKKTKTFAQLLDERALYGTKVTFEP